MKDGNISLNLYYVSRKILANEIDEEIERKKVENTVERH